MLQKLQKLQVLSTDYDGSPLPPGTQRIDMNMVIFDTMLSLAAHVLEDLMNAFVYPANATWNNPQELVAALTFACHQVCTVAGYSICWHSRYSDSQLASS